VCNTCEREFPFTEEYFRIAYGRIKKADGTYYLRAKCRRCCNARVRERVKEAVATDAAVKKAAGSAKWVPKVVTDEGPTGGFTQYPDDGYRFVCLPDSHGDLIDWEAAEAALAFIRYYRPVRVFLLGDHVDFAAFSRFDKPPSDNARVADDVAAARKFLGLVRESAPNARISYRKGNHEARLAKHLWKNEAIAKILEADGVDLPRILRLGDLNIEWIESGTEQVNDALIVKHGHLVRMRSGYTATGELERNGISGISGHTHRLGQIFKRSRVGMLTWVESGCLCQYDPQYLEGQTADWCHGLSFGTVSLRGRSFSIHTAPVIKGKVKALGLDIGA